MTSLGIACSTGRWRVSDEIKYRDTRYMTKIQWAYYDFIYDFMSKNGYSPSYKEIAERFGVYKSTVQRMLYKLNAAGHVKLTPGANRHIILVAQPDRRVRNAEVKFSGRAANRSHDIYK